MLDFVKSKRFNAPFAVNYDITWRCNLRCVHCYYWRSIEQLGIAHRELTSGEWHEEFLRARAAGAHSASLTGGEPTLRMDVIRDAYNIFPIIQIATNGVKKVPEDIKCCIWVSIDGDEEIHNKIRGATIYQKVLENISGDKRVAISTTLTTENYDQVLTITRQMKMVGVRGIFFMLFSGSKSDPLYLTNEKFESVITGIQRAKKEFPNFVFHSQKMVKNLCNKPHANNCVFLRKQPLIRSFFADLTPKRCVMGDNVDCATCTCIVPLTAYVLRPLHFDMETFREMQHILYSGKN
ncbi:MAG: radical SAM domain protein [Promethearchaeota archaeon CR_4]|nr:MAG: radical SAM domain protein [Candidatus Lokiarchaeota archaeon CR_4]